MSILEPIDEKDLDLKNKFTEKPEAGGQKAENLPEEKKIEDIQIGENISEKPEINTEKVVDVYDKILSKVKTNQAVDTGAISLDAEKTDRENSAESKIEKLIQLAQQKGVAHAVKVARHLEDNYALDEFHDRLLGDDLHAALVQRGLIEEL